MFLRFLKNSYRLEYASMNIYTLLRFYRVIKSPRLKLLGFLCLHILHKRYLYILIDPSLSCNLRCRLCFFSDPDYSAATKGFFTQEDIHALANSVFHRGIKIQIGCGAEPMTYSRLHELVKLMGVGEKANAIIPSFLAYGISGDGLEVPALSSMICEIELIKIL